MGFVEPPKGNDIEIRRGPEMNVKKGCVTIELGKNGVSNGFEGLGSDDIMSDTN